MTYRIETITNRLNSEQSRTTSIMIMVGLHSRDMARQQFDAGASWVQITIYECYDSAGKDCEYQLYSGLFTHIDQLVLATKRELHDKEYRDCPQG